MSGVAETGNASVLMIMSVVVPRKVVVVLCALAVAGLYIEDI